MFIDKLWIRIKGELLTLKEDLAVTEDLRTKAGRLLDHVQERVIKGHAYPRAADREDPVPPRGGSEEVSRRTRMNLADIEQEWQEIAKERDRQKGLDEETNSPPPNPRRLG
jgi:hypothetical protein